MQPSIGDRARARTRHVALVEKLALLAMALSGFLVLAPRGFVESRWDCGVTRENIGGGAQVQSGPWAVGSLASAKNGWRLRPLSQVAQLNGELVLDEKLFERLGLAIRWAETPVLQAGHSQGPIAHYCGDR
uniref:Uncharacterized protein n=1 Tax=Oryza sativa subsp. japonica TaxID=39947 RepID=Q6ZGY6_ORYSJ|nr:hypothetical protein [Oryza sativa Japonica Group]